MKNSIAITLLIITVLLVGKAMGQNVKADKGIVEPTPRETLLSQLASDCFNSHQYDRLQRLKIYPFSKASKVKLISFDTEKFIPRKMKDVDAFKFKESTVLASNETDELTDILYNVGYNPNIKTDFRIEDNYGCYNPQNGILFLNADGKVFDYIEICFECQRTQTTSKKINEGTFCNQKFSLLKDFFLKVGIKHGTVSQTPILTYAEIFNLDTADALHEIRRKLSDKMLGSDTLARLNSTEQKLLFLLNGRSIYHDDISRSGFAAFYYNDSGSFYDQTIAALEEIGAVKTVTAFKSSILQWPDKQIPQNKATRRELFLEIINTAVPKWTAIEDELYNHEIITGGVELTKKEDIDSLVYNYIIAYKEHLKD